MSFPVIQPFPKPPQPPGERRRRPLRRGASLLPSLFTVANLGMGWLSIQQSLLALQSANPENLLNEAAKAIGWALLLDGLDGFAARLAGASSAFGREFDSLADVISFGVAPALLAYVWGIRFLALNTVAAANVNRVAQFVAFLYVVAGAARLARFNIASPELGPSNPGKPGKRYFVGLPIPAAAGTIAAVVHLFAAPVYFNSVNTSLSWAIAWLACVLLLAFLMVSTWRCFSFKSIDFRRRRMYTTVVIIAAIIGAIWIYSEIFFVAAVVLYLGSAFYWRLGHYLRRRHA